MEYDRAAVRIAGNDARTGVVPAFQDTRMGREVEAGRRVLAAMALDTVAFEKGDHVVLERDRRRFDRIDGLDLRV